MRRRTGGWSTGSPPSLPAALAQALLSSQPRAASVVARGATRCLELKQADFEWLIVEKGSIKQVGIPPPFMKPAASPGR